MVGIRDRLRDAYEDAADIGKDAADLGKNLGKDAADRAYDLYTDDRIRQAEEASVLSHLSTSERYEEIARSDADVLRTFEAEGRNVYTVEELDVLYDEAQEELELTGSPVLDLPDRETLEQNAPKTAAKFALRRALKLPAGAGVALDVEYEIGNTLRRARRLEEQGEELEAELMRAALADRLAVVDQLPFVDRIPFADKIPFQDPELSTDRLDTRYAERRQAIEERDGHPLLGKIRDAVRR